MKQFSSMCGLIAAVVLLLVGASCSEPSRGRLLHNIPESATMTAIVNFGELTDAGLTDENASKISSNLSEVRGVVSSANNDGVAAFFSQGSGLDLTVFAVDNDDNFTSSLTAAGFSTGSADDAETRIFSNGNSNLRVALSKLTPGYGWMADCRSDEQLAEAITNAVNLSKDNNITKYKGIAEYLENQSGALIMALNCHQLDEKLPLDGDEQQWLCSTLPVSDKTVALNGQRMLSTGKPVEIPGFKTISNDFLRYVPDNAAMVAAVGLTPEVDWDAASRLVSAFNREANFAVSLVLPYLKSIDGTVAVAAVPREGADINNPSPDMIDFLVMAHMPQKEVNDAIEQIRSLAEQTGLKPQTDKEGITTVALGDMTVKLGNIDGYLALSTLPLDGKANNSFAPDMEGKEGAMVCVVPLSWLSADKQGTLRSVFNLTTSGYSLKLTAPGAQGDIIPLLLSL